MEIPVLGDLGVTEKDLAPIADISGNKYNPAQFDSKEMIKILHGRLYF